MIFIVLIQMFISKFTNSCQVKWPLNWSPQNMLKYGTCVSDGGWDWEICPCANSGQSSVTLKTYKNITYRTINKNSISLYFVKHSHLIFFLFKKNVHVVKPKGYIMKSWRTVMEVKASCTSGAAKLPSNFFYFVAGILTMFDWRECQASVKYIFEAVHLVFNNNVSFSFAPLESASF